MSRCPRHDDPSAALRGCAQSRPDRGLRRARRCRRMDASTERPCASTRVGTPTAVMRPRRAWSRLVRRSPWICAAAPPASTFAICRPRFPCRASPATCSLTTRSARAATRGRRLEPSIDRRWRARRSVRERRGRSHSDARQRRRYTAKGEVAGLDVQRVGREFQIQALAADRYRSVVNGTFDMTGSGGGRLSTDARRDRHARRLAAVRRHVPAHGRDHEPVRRRHPCEDDRIVRRPGSGGDHGERPRCREAHRVDRRATRRFAATRAA